jgi:hypothetical protein
MAETEGNYLSAAAARKAASAKMKAYWKKRKKATSK